MILDHDNERVPDLRIEDDSLEIDSDDEFADAAPEEAADATAALHGAGGDADRAELITESTDWVRRRDPVPDDERRV